MTVVHSAARPGHPATSQLRNEFRQASEGTSRGPGQAASRQSLLERRRRDLHAAEGELQTALRLTAQTEQALREAERALRNAWDAAGRSARASGVEGDAVVYLRMRRAALVQAKQANHRAADAAAMRVAAARLAVESVDAMTRRMLSAITQRETSVAALRRGIAIAEQQLENRRESLRAEERALEDLRRKLIDLAGS